jgi:hypothetical protein
MPSGARRRDAAELIMKKSIELELRAEYDFSEMKGGIRGKYVAAYHQGAQLVRLDPDTAEPVNKRNAGHGLRRRSGEEPRKE